MLLQLYQILIKLQSYPMRLRTAYSIAKFLSSTQSDYQIIVNHLQNTILESALLDGEGNPSKNAAGDYIIAPEKYEQCIQEMEDIKAISIDTEALKIYFDDLPENLLSPQEIIILMPYIVKE